MVPFEPLICACMVGFEVRPYVLCGFSEKFEREEREKARERGRGLWGVCVCGPHTNTSSKQHFYNTNHKISRSKLDQNKLGQ